MSKLPKKFLKNFIVLDLETSGLDADRCGILEIGAVDPTGRPFYRRVALGRGRRVEWQALECNGIDVLDIGYGVPVYDAMHDLFSWLREDGYQGRFIMGGKNPQFDYSFLKANWPKNIKEPLEEVISRRCLDLHSLAYGMALQLGLDISGKDFKTDDIYQSIGLDPEPKPHNPLRGAAHEMEGFKRMLLGKKSAMPQSDFDYLMNSLKRELLKNTKSFL